MLFWHRGDQRHDDSPCQRIENWIIHMISYNGAVITDLKEDKIILNKC
jgi:hypothetical protein